MLTFAETKTYTTMLYKIEKTYLYTMSDIIEAENLEEAKKMFETGDYDLDDDDTLSEIASILMQPGDGYEDREYAEDIDEWKEVAGYNDIIWERTDF